MIVLNIILFIPLLAVKILFWLIGVVLHLSYIVISVLTGVVTTILGGVYSLGGVASIILAAFIPQLRVQLVLVGVGCILLGRFFIVLPEIIDSLDVIHEFFYECAFGIPLIFCGAKKAPSIPDAVPVALPLPLPVFAPTPGYFPADDSAKDYNHKHKTARGEFVRSKSEVIIADALFYNNISFEYEKELWIDGKRYLPDFTIYVPGKQPIYWEHCGMMNDMGYRRRWEEKKADYALHGINGANLIVTYDDDNEAIDAQEVFTIIQKRLLLFNL
jgi:hypothetical protein